ncbi:MAG TPA: histidine--tRNA ligase [Candidatus Polarisedimenticolaceae bacterium]|nr:histidine--tRNA ligase [Candidatus Polarisedimenticolaceae bacterium]
MALRYQALRGTHDILPEEIGAWQRLESATREVFARYGFREIRTPVLEATELFARSVGASTDIVRKEMYTFAAGDESVTMRPENTAPVVRAFVEHARHRTVAAGYPERLYYLGPMFRYERPQKGRQRQFHQIGAEVLGAAEPAVDAETIDMIVTLLDAVGVRERELRLNSVGDTATRARYRELLTAWLAPHLPTMCDDCRRRAVENPLRVFDCKVDADRKRLEEAPRVVDHLSEESAAHFAAVRRSLDAYGIAYVVDPRLVRGLDYYERTVFEIVSGALGAQNALVGGGRYDGLVEEIGGPSVPGFGFAAGMERIVMTMSEEARASDVPDVALVALGDAGFEAIPALAQELRRTGLSVVAPVAPRPLGAQMKRAERVGARFALFVGEGEIARGSYGLKDLRTGEQKDVARAELAGAIRDGRIAHGR